MRKSKLDFLERCTDFKIFLQVGSYTIYDYEDGDYADFKVRKIKDVRGLVRLAGKLEFIIIEEGGNIVVRLFEDYQEY